MAEPLVSLGDDNKSVTLFGQWVLEDPLLFEMLTREKTAPKQKAFLEQAIKLGAYTLSISEMQVGLLGVVKDLDAQLIHLKHAFDVRTIEDKGAGRGTAAEETLQEHFVRLFEHTDDSVTPTGATVGELPRRKVGDFVISLAGSNRTIALESKFDKSKTMGSKVAPKEEHAVGQIILSSANRDAQYAIFIAEEGSAAAKQIPGIMFDPAVAGFYVVTNPKTADYRNLDLAIELARALTLSLDQSPEMHQHVLLCSELLLHESAKLIGLDAQIQSMIMAGQNIISAAESMTETISDGQARLEEIQVFLTGLGKADISEQEQRIRRLEILIKDKSYR
jgi:hypothetical protein